MTRPRLLIVPGYGGSGPEHWQSRWEAGLADAVRFAPASWEYPDADDWDDALTTAVGRTTAPTLILAHSLGCLTAARWLLAHRPTGIAGVVLVAPPDPAGPVFPATAHGFTVPEEALPVPSVILASVDDPYADPRAVTAMGRWWGSPVATMGAHGHLNSESGLGDWAAGRAVVTAFAAGLGFEEALWANTDDVGLRTCPQE